MTTRERASMLVEFGKLHSKVDSILEHISETKHTFEVIDSRLTSLETTRTKQRAYWRSMVVVGGAMLAILGKLVFFSPTVQVRIPPVP
jgi:hypothetical protein